jgi:hypothetical protein
VLYGAIELARDESVDGYRYLRNAIEEGAANLLPAPRRCAGHGNRRLCHSVFVHSQGGLDPAADFQDGDAYDALLASFTEAGLESPQGQGGAGQPCLRPERNRKNHLWPAAQHGARSRAIAEQQENHGSAGAERSMAAGWAASSFGPDDSAVELRFLLGFALKRADDPFYAVPAKEKAADAYFAQRAERYQKWTEQYAPMVARCLGRGRAAIPPAPELPVSGSVLWRARHCAGRICDAADAGHAQSGHGRPCAGAAAGHHRADRHRRRMVLRVQLRAGDSVLAECDKALDLTADLEIEVDDVSDALASLGLGLSQLSVALRFDADGQPQQLRPLA